jgi:hypothetical protein
MEHNERYSFDNYTYEGNYTWVPRDFRDIFLAGVYNNTYEVLYNGGPSCASESTFIFKLMMTLRLIPWYIIGAYFLFSFIKTANKRVTNKVEPSLFERLTGIICFASIGVQIYTKYRAQTMIFLFNPCHVFTITWGIILNRKYDLTNQILFLFAISNVSSPTIGMIFAENDELESKLEIISYWVQHWIVALIAPLI